MFPIPDAIPSALAAPMMCAGITSYSPLVRNGAGPGKKVAIVGLGGLGHFGVLFSKALGELPSSRSTERYSDFSDRCLYCYFISRISWDVAKP